ncbi:hypothetical protein [Thalassobacillus sp. CUG 92003]|uniref:hypothetical protein n=1 Tax=Thalassobacillus sp. CUG 92003 TaxID=2736641 RepID=UPI0015E731FF|nr:hypothetical protein [Thalassobacillus sp. CUG 92003]
MNSTIEVIRRVELPKHTKNMKRLFFRYPLPMLTGSLSALLLYTLFFTIVVRYLTSFPLNVGDTVHAAAILSLLFTCFLIIFSRGKLGDHNVVGLFFNSHVKAHQLIIASYFPLYVFFQVLFFLTYSPVLVAFYLQGNAVVLYLLLLFICLTIVFLFSLSTWMVSTRICYKLINKYHDNFYLHAILFLTLLWLTFFALRELSSMSGSSFLLGAGLVLITALSLVSMLKLSTGFLMQLFKSSQNSIASKETKSYTLPQKRPMIHAALDALYYYRFGLLRELVFTFLVLIIVTFAFHLMFDATTFVYLYSFILNIGVKEIMIIAPLYIGMHYREHHLAFYNLNDRALTFLLPRLGMALGINVAIHLTFVLINYIALNQNFAFGLNAVASILFVTLVSVWVGFNFVINERNKAAALIGTLIFVGLLEFVLGNYLSTESHLTIFYALMSVVFLMVIKLFYVRKPIIK